MLHRPDAFLRPAFLPEDEGGEISRAQVVLAAHVAAGGGAVGVVQQGGGIHDLRVSAFCLRQALRHAVHALNVREIVHGVSVFVPFTGFFESYHGHPIIISRIN